MAIVLSLVVLLVVSVLAAVIIRNALQYRSDVRSHWYSVGYRDGTQSSFWYDIHNQANPVIINAYMAGYTDSRKGL